MIDCPGYGAGLYSLPSQARTAINQSRFSPIARRSGHAISEDITPGQKSAKKFLERYGEQLVCICYRYTGDRYIVD